MKRTWASYLLVLLGTLVMLSCSSSSTDEDDEFIATLSDFEGYTSWTKTETLYGPDPLLQAAHAANDSLYRTTYIKNNAQPVSGKYSTGTLIVKELRTEDGTLTGALTMMAKRGADFNPDGNGWEWFMTDIDLTSVITQGDNATAGGGMCASCHGGANVNNNGTDWVFNHNPAQ